MTRLNLEKEILQKIKRDGIKPKPRFFFVLKNTFFWFLTSVFILFGALSFALVLYKISGNYQIFKTILESNLNLSEFIIYLFPYFWIIMAVILLSFIGGTLFFYLGFAQKADQISQKYLPFYNKYQKIQEVKKKIFISKLKELGITNEILSANKNLKKKVEDKFDKNVLGKTYLFRKPQLCLKESFKCKNDQVFFEDQKGCGCRDVYYDFKFDK